MSRNKRRRKRASVRKPMPPPARAHKDTRREKDLREAREMMRQVLNPFGFDEE